MMLLRYQCKSSPTGPTSINFYIDPYSPSEEFSIEWAPASTRKFLATTQALNKNNIKSEVKKRFNSKAKQKIFLAVRDCRKAIDALYQENLLSNEDRADIEATIRKVETQIATQDSLAPNYTSMQKDVLISIIEPYVEDFFAIATNEKTALKFFKVGCKQTALFPNADNILNKVLAEILTEFPSIEQKKQVLFGSMVAFSKCFNGEANLESTFARVGQGSVPHLESQQKIIIDFAAEKWPERFPQSEQSEELLALLALKPKEPSLVQPSLGGLFTLPPQPASQGSVQSTSMPMMSSSS